MFALYRIVMGLPVVLTKDGLSVNADHCYTTYNGVRYVPRLFRKSSKALIEAHKRGAQWTARKYDGPKPMGWQEDSE
jgi:hypothetical protein